MANTDSEFVASVLSDYSITEEEYSEVLDKQLACMIERGVEADLQSNGNGSKFINYHLETGDEAAKQEVFNECWTLWDGGLGSLYEQILSNPNNEDRYVLTAECLIRVGLAPEGFTTDELRELEDSGAYRMAASEDDQGNLVEDVVKAPTNPDPRLPGGEPVHGGAAEECWMRPLEAGIGK
ncbi:MAG: hypothetical protein LBH48_07850 [Bifidobacteriaceae bacterium]|nr:hypothetical protein [Bifidobacteriaceae bacterium]